MKRNGEGLFNWFFAQNGEVNGFANAYWGGVTTLELARVIEYSIANHLSGLLHVSNGEKISKFNLLVLFKEVWGFENVQVLKHSGKSIDKSLVKSKRVDFQIPSYPEMLGNLKKWMDKNPQLYSEIYG